MSVSAESGIDYSSPFTYTSSDGSGGQPMGSAFTYKKTPHRPAVPYSTFQSAHVPTAKGGDTQVMIAYVVAFVGYVLVVLTMPFSLFFSLKWVSEKERLVMFRLGRYWAIKGPGTIATVPFIDKTEKIDLNTKVFLIPPMLVVLADGATISVGATVTYCIQDPVTVTLSLQNVNHTMRTLGQATLFHVLNKYSLEQLRRDKGVDHVLRQELNDCICEWGLETSRVELSAVTELSQPPSAIEEVQEKLGPMFKEMGGMNMMGSMLSQFAQQSAANRPTTSSSATALQLGTVAEETGDLRRLHTAMSSLINDELVDQVGTVIMFEIISESQGQVQQFILDLKHKPGGIIPASQIVGEVTYDAKVTISQRDLLLMMRGELSKLSAYMAGRVEVEGDTQALYALQPLEDKLAHLL